MEIPREVTVADVLWSSTLYPLCPPNFKGLWYIPCTPESHGKPATAVWMCG